MFNLTLKSVCFHRGESSSSILLSDLERIFFFSLCRFYSAGSQSKAICRRWPSHYWLAFHLGNTYAVNIITSKLLQMESNGDQWLKEQVLFFKKWLLSSHVCGIYTAGQMWLRWPSDQPLVSPYSASLLSIKPVMRIMAIINLEILSWCTNKFLELWCQENWRTLKEN